MQWGLERAWVLAIAMALPMALSLAPAVARAQDVCSDLQSQLVNLPFATDSGQQVRAYASAIARQTIELRQAGADLRRLGCSNGSVTVFGGRNAGACAAIASTIDQMERNLRHLVQQRDETAVGGDPAERGRILAALSENGCEDTTAVEASAEADVTMEGGDFPENSDPQADLPTTFDNMGGAAAQDGPLRTMCVRTCDGGFFPISSGATPLDFRRDQRTCSMMCPQTETELFYQPLQSLDSGSMISTLTGRPYSTLTKAFAYQSRDRSADPSCGCDLAGYHRKMAGAGGGASNVEAHTNPGTTRRDVGSVTTIRMHPTSAAAPGTVVNERPYDPEKDRVRMVGPSFLPDDQPPLDLRNPGGAN